VEMDIVELQGGINNSLFGFYSYNALHSFVKDYDPSHYAPCKHALWASYHSRRVTGTSPAMTG